MIRFLILAAALSLPAAAQTTKKRTPPPPPAVAPAPSPAPAPAPVRTAVVVQPAPQPKRLFVAPKAGVTFAGSGLGAAFTAGLQVGTQTPLLDDHLAVSLEADWARPRTSGTLASTQVPGGTAPWALGLAQTSVLARADYRVPTAWNDVAAYAGLGAGVGFYRASVDSLGVNHLETQGRGIVQAQVGGELPVGPGGVLLELRYRWAPVKMVTTGDVNTGGPALLAGYAVRF